jgi:hypothetical protein
MPAQPQFHVDTKRMSNQNKQVVQVQHFLHVSTQTRAAGSFPTTQLRYTPLPKIPLHIRRK